MSSGAFSMRSQPQSCPPPINPSPRSESADVDTWDMHPTFPIGAIPTPSAFAPGRPGTAEQDAAPSLGGRTLCALKRFLGAARCERTVRVLETETSQLTPLGRTPSPVPGPLSSRQPRRSARSLATLASNFGRLPRATRSGMLMRERGLARRACRLLSCDWPRRGGRMTVCK